MTDKRNISSLFNWKDNPRAIKKEKFEELKNRIKRHGQIKPLIITDEGEVLGGNMRLRAFKDLNISEAWVSVVKPKNEAEKIEIALIDNEEMGYYEDQALAELIDKYKDDIDLTKYSIHLTQPRTLEDILNEFSPDEIVEDEAPELPEEAESKLGEVYQLGRHRLMCGDSTSIEDVEKLMDGNKADMVFTDPPYGVNIGDKSGRAILGDDNPDVMTDVVRDAFVNISMSIKDGAGYYICSPQGGDMELMMMMMRDAGIKCRHQIIWKKDVAVFSMGRLDYDYQHEPILYGWKKAHQFYAKNKKSVWEFDRPKSSKLHPTMKPVGLVSEAVNNSSKADDIVLDLFGGSGSTLIACEQTDRTCYMMELDPKYIDVIRKRYHKFVTDSDEGWEDATAAI
jgi:DNA modification methylase